MKLFGGLIAALILAQAGPASAQAATTAAWPDSRFTLGPLLYQDDFTDLALKNWSPELEADGVVTIGNRRLIVDVPKGLTLWFRPELSGPVLIQYDADVISRGGPNDRVSDLNCFWMAQDPQRPGHLLDTPRKGRFKDYDTLTTYYAGQGGNGNTTTRFRRYIGREGNRPLRSEDDLSDPADLLTPNTWQTIRLVAFGSVIQYYRDDRKVFEMNDPDPYTHGWFALRTTDNHMEVRRFRVYRLLPALNTAGQK